MSYYYGKGESILLTLLIYNVPGFLAGAGIAGLAWWWFG